MKIKKNKNEKGKGGEGRSCFSQSLAALASRVISQKRHMVRQVQTMKSFWRSVGGEVEGKKPRCTPVQ